MKRGLVCLLCAVLATSCSWAFVHAPPSHHPTDPGDCTDSRVAPVLDTVFTGFTALLVGGLLIKCTDHSGNNQDGTPADGCTTGQWLGLGWTAVVGTATGISAYSGFRDTGRCRNRRALEQPIATVR